MDSTRINCPMRHENGNCLPCGGFCLAVSNEICRGLRNAYRDGASSKVVHGRWEKVTGGMVKLGDCSECKVRQPVLGTNYCKNCGADMRERKNNGQ